MEEGSIELILGTYLKRALSELNIDFGSLVIFDNEKKVTSMIRIGEFEFEEEIIRNIGTEPFLSIIERKEPQIITRDLKVPLLSFKKRTIKSEMIVPLELKNGKVALFFLPSSEKEHFREKHLEKIKKIVDEIYLYFDKGKLEYKRTLVLYNCHVYKNLISNLFKNEFRTVCISDIEQINNPELNSAELILLECLSRCSLECGRLFSLLNENKIAFGILRPIELKKSGEMFISYNFHKCSSNIQIYHRILELLNSLRKSIHYKISETERKLLEVISFIERKSMEDSIFNLKIHEISKSLNLSRSFLSIEFKTTTGQPLKEFISQFKMCNSLHYLTNGRSVKIASYFLGYRSRTAFIDRFKKYFGFYPSFLKTITKKRHKIRQNLFD